MKKKVRIFFITVRCLYAFIWRACFVLLLQVFGRLTPKRLNYHLRKGSVKILKIVKAEYKITYTHPLYLENNKYYIFFSNHLSFFDIILIYATIMGNVRVVVKKELLAIPLLGKILILMGCIPVDRENIVYSDLSQGIQKELTHHMLWIFPEGTRSLTGKLLPFKSGCFRIACELSAQVVPVAVVGTDKVLPPKKRLPTLNQRLHIRIGKPIDTRNYITVSEQKKLLEQVRQEISGLMEITECHT